MIDPGSQWQLLANLRRPLDRLQLHPTANTGNDRPHTLTQAMTRDGATVTRMVSQLELMATTIESSAIRDARREVERGLAGDVVETALALIRTAGRNIDGHGARDLAATAAHRGAPRLEPAWTPPTSYTLVTSIYARGSRHEWIRTPGLSENLCQARAADVVLRADGSAYCEPKGSPLVRADCHTIRERGREPA